jgi:hypothetical protein
MNGQMYIVSTEGIILFHCKKHPKSHHELRVILEKLTSLTQTNAHPEGIQMFISIFKESKSVLSHE